MILRSNVGICVESNEKSETSELSDFKISEFKELKTLIIFEGWRVYMGQYILLMFLFW